MKKLLFYSVLSLGVMSCGKGSDGDDSCNGDRTRRDIKLALDADAHEIDTIPILTTVDSLGGLDLITAKTKTPRQDIEKKVFIVTSKVDKLIESGDGDFVIKLVSDDENYMNTESPNPGCEYLKESVFLDQILAAREWIELNKDQIEGSIVTVTGIAFIDKTHPYPRNVADNNIELHPILDIHFE